MKTRIILSSAFILGLCSITGCYTQFQAPVRDSDSQDLQGSLQEAADNAAVETNQDYLINPSIPASMMNSYDWQFYYSSPWWRDNPSYAPYGSATSSDAAEPRSFERRSPAGTSDDHYAPATVASPSAPPAHLAKPAEGDKSSSGNAGSQDNRRDFDRRSQTEEKKDSGEKRTREP